MTTWCIYMYWKLKLLLHLHTDLKQDVDLSQSCMNIYFCFLCSLLADTSFKYRNLKIPHYGQHQMYLGRCGTLCMRFLPCHQLRGKKMGTRSAPVPTSTPGSPGHVHRMLSWAGWVRGTQTRTSPAAGPWPAGTCITELPVFKSINYLPV